MPSSTIQGWLDDESIPIEKRTKIWEDLDKDLVDEAQVENLIKQKYGNKYGANQQPSQEPVPTDQVSTSPDLPQSEAQPKPQGGPDPNKPWWQKAVDTAAQNSVMMDFSGLAGDSQKGEGIRNFNANAAASALDTLSNTNSFLAKNLSPISAITPNAAVDFVDKGVKDFTGGVRGRSFKENQADEGSFSSVTGDITGQVLGSIPAMGAAGKVAQGLGWGAKTLEKAPAISKLAGFLGRSGLGTTAATASAEGRLPTKEELAAGGIFDTVLHGLGGLAGKAGNKIYQWGLKPKVAGDDFQKAAKIADKAMDLKLTGSAESIFNKSKKIISRDGELLKGLVSKSKMSFDKNSLVNSVVKKATQLENAGDKDLAENLINEVRKFLDTQPEKINAVRNYDIKKQASSVILPTLKKGDLGNTATTAKKMMWEEIWKNASGNLNKVSDKAKTLNDNMNVAYTIKEAANKKANPTKPNLMNIFGLDKVLFSPTATTNLGRKLRQFKGGAQSEKARNVIKSATAGLLGNLFPQKQQAES